jgi:hypothetical protein
MLNTFLTAANSSRRRSQSLIPGNALLCMDIIVRSGHAGVPTFALVIVCFNYLLPLQDIHGRPVFHKQAGPLSSILLPPACGAPRSQYASTPPRS